MSDQVQIKIRTTEELKSKIHRLTEITGRSVNSEINHLLEMAINGNFIPEEKITAEEARRRSEIARIDMSTRLTEEVFEQIHSSVMFGHTDMSLSLDDLTIEDENDPIIKAVLCPLLGLLEELGYEAEIKDLEQLIVRW
ncbi:Arc family DNA-binding protein [Vibrio navarrensis]|uniref:Arc family DNA-binding protein n=1 Tax=Vibrio navarrensis TaxID=29495 RepID=UPI00186A9FBC|nr:Arc family DNA-binding protein [Vibrio navarrensis]